MGVHVVVVAQWRIHDFSEGPGVLHVKLSDAVRFRPDTKSGGRSLCEAQSKYHREFRTMGFTPIDLGICSIKRIQSAQDNSKYI